MVSGTVMNLVCSIGAIALVGVGIPLGLSVFFPEQMRASERTNHVDRVVDEEYGVVCYADRASSGFQCLHLIEWEERKTVEIKTLNNRSLSWQQPQQK